MREASFRRARAFVLAALASASAHCEPEAYPLQPSFCDDWCRALLRAGCDEEPENCVRECELSRAPSGCASPERELLACYEAAPSSAFGCTDRGFNESASPEESTCALERDALIDCAYPEVKVCLDVCREIEATLADDPASADPACPSPDLPCDSLCWVGRARLVGDVALDRDTARAVSRALLTCAVDRAADCRLVPDVGVPKANWASVLSDCADILGGSPGSD